ncbi:PfkB family carbohydrate kinase [Photobacterium minamisatsumaniensis]|uniref:ribokinase n=1 Tax=Photobacterium minamisatsumaniensis TaxID=2910233 RepID=UPI003D106B10
MLKQQRINTLRSILLKEKQVSVNDMAKQLKVTDRTIRRDLKQLEQLGIAELYFGGAKLVNVNKADLFKQVGMKTIMTTLSEKYQKENMPTDSAKQDHIGLYILGSFNIDIVSEVANFPKEGQTIHSLSTNFYAGGKGSNQATAAANVCDAVHLGVKIGKDEFGTKARNYFSSTNIHSFTVFEDESKPTGNAQIFVSRNSGENFIAIDLGANLTITEQELDQEYALIQESKVFLTQLENNFSATKAAIECASATQSLVIVNPAPYVEDVKSIMHLIDIITPNETEAQDLSGIEVTDLASAKKAAEAIHTMGTNIVLMTMGSNGALLFDGEHHRHFPPFKAVVTDTSGAGDSFNGSLAASLANGKPLEYAVKYASAFASLAVERKGASNMPEASLVESRMQSQEIM